MHRIEIDDDVYTELERHVRGFEQPNDVLRRLLLEDGELKTPSAHTRPSFVAGRLLPLLNAGLITPGDELVHKQVRKGRTFIAKVDDSGWIVTDRDRYKEPSPALRDLVGSQIDGWAYWTHVPSGQTLRKLRDTMQQEQAK